MRYKFRAKMLDKPDTWVYGGYYEVGGNAVILHESRGNAMQHTAVDPETVGQWTGKYDSKGTEIYEGDKMECQTCSIEHPTVTIDIYWNEYWAGWSCGCKMAGLWESIPEIMDEEAKCKVIESMYDKIK